MSQTYNTVCFDMDGTLIRNTDSVKYLCQLAGVQEKAIEIDEKELEGKLSWIEADHLRAELINGLSLKLIGRGFTESIQVIKGLQELIMHFQDNGMACILVTAGPIEVAYELSRHYDFDKVYGSEYEVVDGKYTGKILNHMGTDGKVISLKKYCEVNGYSLDDVVAIGDSESDIGVFNEVGLSIAINYNQSLVGKADKYIVTEDISKLIDLV